MSLKLDGLQELRDALGKLPQDFHNQAGQIISDHGAELRSETQAGYPQVTGNLRRGVAMQLSHSNTGVLAIVKSSAKHASIFEKGTVQRQTSRGANRGRMPAADDAQRMIPKAIRIRKAMYASLVDMVKAAGFEVSVD